MKALKTPGGLVRDEMLAGAYFWLSIPDDPVSLARVRAAFRDHGLDPARLPKDRRPEHVLQEACRRVEGTEQGAVKVVVRAEQVVHDSAELVYQITRHVTDLKNRVVEHPKALRVSYEKETGQLTFETLDRSRRTRGTLRELEERIRDRFERGATKIIGHNLRTIVRKYIEAVGAENMRGHSGGVYFLAKDNPLREGTPIASFHGTTVNGLDFLESLGSALGAIYTEPEFHVVPCINDAQQRAFLKRKFIENADEEVGAFCGRLKKLVAERRRRGFRRDLVENMVAQREELDVRRRRFATIVGGRIRELDSAMKDADAALTKFLDADEKEAA